MRRGPASDEEYGTLARFFLMDDNYRLNVKSFLPQIMASPELAG